MIRTTNEKLAKRIVWYAKLGIPYKLTATNHRIQIEGEGSTFVSKESLLPANELYLIKQVRKEIVENKLHDNIPKYLKSKTIERRICYYDFNDFIKPGFEIDNVLEIDLSSAYWETAYKLGLLPDAIYEKGKTVSKRTRLAAIGSLGKRKLIRHFDGKDEFTIYDKRSELFYLWNAICFRVSEIMNEAAKEAGEDFLFFWVDAMFVKPRSKNKVIKVFKKHGYDFKSYNIQKIYTEGKYLKVKSSEKTSKIIVNDIETITDIRPFPLSKKNSSK